MNQQGEFLKWKRLSARLLMATILATGAAAQTAKKDSVHEQSSFNAEDETVERPAALPEGVLIILRNDPGILNTLKVDKLLPGQLPLAWFLASEIHLGGHDQTDLIVMGVGPLRGANVNTFWIFRKAPQGYELILNEVAHDLRVLRTRGKGYRDIRLAAVVSQAAVTLLYRFNGHKYQLYKRKVWLIQ